MSLSKVASEERATLVLPKVVPDVVKPGVTTKRKSYVSMLLQEVIVPGNTLETVIQGSKKETEVVVTNSFSLQPTQHKLMMSPSGYQTRIVTPERKDRGSVSWSEFSNGVVTTSGFIVNELLTDMDSMTIDAIRRRFDLSGGSVSKSEFVDTMKEYINTEKTAEKEEWLAELFAEIDINGDQELSWEEFTTFIIKNGAATEKSQMNKRFVQCELSNEIRFNQLEKLKYFPKMDRMIACDHSKTVKLYKPVTVKYQKPDYVLTKELRGHTGACLNSEYLSTFNYLATSSSDCTVKFWDINSNYRLLKHEIVKEYPQLSMVYNPQFRLLFTGGMKGPIGCFVMDAEKPRERTIFKGHADMTMDLKMITNTPLLASAGLDGKIMLWDTTTAAMSTALTGHVKGVFSLAYAPEHRLLFSASFDRDVLVWNPMVEALVYRLKGHHTSLVGVEVIEGTPQLVSADQDGIFKVWDVRTWECIQSFSSSAFSGSQGLSSFALAGPHNQILAGAKSLYSFQYDRPGKPWLTHNEPIEAIIYNEGSSTILTAGGKDIRIWDAINGALLRSFAGLTGHKITSVCLDDRQRKMIVGDTKGKVMVYNYNNGGLLRELAPHNAEVSALIHASSKLIISASWDSKVCVHNELLPHNTSSVIRSVTCNDKDATGMSYSQNLGLFAVADGSNSVRVWDFDTCFPELQFKLDVEVSSILLAEYYPVLFVADSEGWIHIWSVRPAPQKNQFVYKFCTKDTDNEEMFVVSAMAFGREEQILFTGDEKGWIKIWSLKQLFNVAKIQLVQKSIVRKLKTAPAIRVSMTYAESGNVTMVKKWWAHSATITRLQLLNENRFVLTGSSDCRVRAWDRDGAYLGTLCQNTNNKWQLPGNWIEDNKNDKQLDTEAELRARRKARAAKFHQGSSKPDIERKSLPAVTKIRSEANVVRNQPLEGRLPVRSLSFEDHLPMLQTMIRGKNPKDEAFMAFLEDEDRQVTNHLSHKQIEAAERLSKALSSISDPTV